ncbi:arrestin domain-containing protein 3-like [Chaetodon auriga]|uniref:arrestin domain-containing protein 3-like n=1 Tax=Chaetodon auriga TaxID=39042 RepID=UPI004032EE9B
MSPIKDFTLTHEALNEEDTFSEGDPVSGTVTFTLSKDTKVKSLFIKAKGEARVHWTEGSGDNKKSYSAHRRYFKVKEYLLGENTEGTVLPQGVHCFKFRLAIPQGEMPSSFKGFHGSIAYTLEAKMSRSWRWPTGAHKELNFVSRSISNHCQVMCPLSGTVGKEVGVFSKGQVSMSATVNKKVCAPGDTLSVVAKICNSSSKTMKPKFSLQKKVVYRASGSTNSTDQSLCKMVGETITENSEETVSCQIKVPDDVIPSLDNCEILSVEYYLKVYLDISFAFDPEVVFPLFIVPSHVAALYPGEAMGPYPAGATGAPSYSDFPAPAIPTGPYPVPAGPGPYGYPAPDPTQHASTASGSYSQWPQPVAPCGYPAAAFPPPSVQHQAPSGPPLFQQGAPPAYVSLFPPSHGTFEGAGSDHKS